MMNGFLLGLATGTSCLATCVPVLAPVLVSEGQGVRSASRLLGRFLAGRLVAYLLLGTLAGGLGRILADQLPWGAIVAIAYLGLGSLLAVHGFREAEPQIACGGRTRLAALRTLAFRRPSLLPVALGVFAGLGWCPPLILAFTAAARSNSPVAGALFLLAFYAGTAVFLVPLPGLAVWHRHRRLRLVARLASGVVGVVYLYRGTLLAIEAVVIS